MCLLSGCFILTEETESVPEQTGAFATDGPPPASTEGPVNTDAPEYTLAPEPPALSDPDPLDSVLELSQADFYAEAGKHIDFYREIAFDSEYGTGTSKIRKWDYEPVFYIYPGEDADKYLPLIRDHIGDLCRIPGFPGFKYTDDPEEATLKLKFISAEEMDELTSGYGEKAYGLTSITWLNFNCHIIRGEIYIVREADCSPEDVRHAVLEELTQSMGLINDSYEFTDSIFYQGYSTTPGLSYIDWLMLRLHYAVEIDAGMEYDEVLHVIDKP